MGSEMCIRDSLETFVAPDVALLFGYENRDVVPWIALRAAISVPIDPQTIMVSQRSGFDRTVEHFPLAPPATGIVQGAIGLRIPIHIERPGLDTVNLLGGVGLTHLRQLSGDRDITLFHGELGLEAKATMGFAMALSEACQNIVEHAGTGGWVSVHAYSFRKRLRRRVVVIAVSDAGVGFRRSLEPTQARRFGDRWGDGAALEAAVIQNVSRFRDPGRGQGIAGIKRYLARWEGKLTIRSGTARIAIVPPWDDDSPMLEHLLDLLVGDQRDLLGRAAPRDHQREDGRRIGVCLLYTSPSPRDGLLSRMPSSA